MIEGVVFKLEVKYSISVKFTHMEKMLFGAIMLLSLSVLVLGNASAELEGKTITGENEHSKIQITIDEDGYANGYLTIQEGEKTTKMEIDGAKSKMFQNDRFLISESGILILGKIVGDDKYLLKARITLDSEKIKHRYLADGKTVVKITGQRDLSAETENLESKNNETNTELSFKEKRALELKLEVEEEARLFQEKLEKDLKKSKEDKITQKEQLMKEALMEIQKKQKEEEAKKNATNNESEESESEETVRAEPTLSDNKEIIIILKTNQYAYWEEEYKFSLKVYDAKINRYDDYFFGDGKIENATISGKISDPDGIVLDTFNGNTTDK